MRCGSAWFFSVPVFQLLQERIFEIESVSSDFVRDQEIIPAELGHPRLVDYIETTEDAHPFKKAGCH
jgi:hypothetical protein